MVFAGIVPLVLLVLIISSVMSFKKGDIESMERGHEMIKTVYVYLILFATLMMTIGVYCCCVYGGVRYCFTASNLSEF